MKKQQLFNLNAYIEVKECLRSYYAQQDYDGFEPYFLLDGVIDLEAYKNSKLRIVSVLAEPWGYCPDDGIVNISSKTLGFPNTPAVVKLTALYWLLEQSRLTGELVPWNEVPYLFTPTNAESVKQHQLLCASAWINVKKRPNHESAANQAVIYEHAIKHHEILGKQLNSVCPDLILVCHKQAFDGLNNSGVFGDNVNAEKLVIQYTDSGVPLLYITHPTRWGYEYLYSVYELLAKEFYNISIVEV